MRITKQAAENAAKKLVEKKREKIAKLNDEFATTVRNMYMATVPEEVRKLFEEKSPYIDLGSRVVLNSHGFNWEYIAQSEYVPIKRNNGNVLLEMSCNDGAFLQRRFQKIRKLEKETDNLELSIATAIYSLKTLKNVEAEFPEAVPFLPTSQTTAVAVNIGPIRQLLSSDNE